MMTFVRVALSFALVGVLLWVFARASAGRLGSFVNGAGSGRSEDPLAIIDRRQFTKGAGVAVVRAGTRHLLVGISERGVELLAEGDDLVVEAVQPEPGAALEPVAASDLSHYEDGLHDAGPHDANVHERGGAWTRLRGPFRPHPARMSFFEALREMTVRRA